MGNVRILEVKQSIFESNDKQAALLREELKKDGVFLLNLMSSPGSGKTTTLTRTIEALKDDLKIGVMEADIDSDVDAETILKTGAKAIQLHTGGMCHLDADMTGQGLKGLGTDDVELVILENVGNLVCPAEFDTGAVKNAMILSVPEGHDKPLKYPGSVSFYTQNNPSLSYFQALHRLRSPGSLYHSLVLKESDSCRPAVLSLLPLPA